jgi:competence protein ComEA
MLLRRALLVLALVLPVAAHADNDFNRASQAELEQLKGIGPALSQAILDERQKGGFTDWRDLMARVSGIGPRLAQRWSQQGWTVAGQPYAALSSR